MTQFVRVVEDGAEQLRGNITLNENAQNVGQIFIHWQSPDKPTLYKRKSPNAVATPVILVNGFGCDFKG